MPGDSTPPQAIDEEHHETDQRGYGSIFIWTPAVLLVFYVLSTGPVIRLHRSGTIGNPMVLYAPLVLLSNKCRPFEKFMDWYVETLWKAK